MSNTHPTEEQLDKAFENWWLVEGSGMSPRLPDEDHETYMRRIARIAWHNGAFVQNFQQNYL